MNVINKQVATCSDVDKLILARFSRSPRVITSTSESCIH